MTYTLWIILTAALVGISCGLVGVFLILRKMAMMADAISHTVLLGIVIAYIMTHTLSGIYMLIGAAINRDPDDISCSVAPFKKCPTRCLDWCCFHDTFCNRCDSDCHKGWKCAS